MTTQDWAPPSAGLSDYAVSHEITQLSVHVHGTADEVTITVTC
jgi:hypothetical protein